MIRPILRPAGDQQRQPPRDAVIIASAPHHRAPSLLVGPQRERDVFEWRAVHVERRLFQQHANLGRVVRVSEGVAVLAGLHALGPHAAIKLEERVRVLQPTWPRRKV
jgi:hypothetical protein